MEVMRAHRSRELAMKVLYLSDTNGEFDALAAAQVAHDCTEDPLVRKRGLEMAAAAWEHRLTADRWSGKVAPQWPVHRQPAVDRNIIRLAVWEMMNTSTPPRVVIDEAIELAKQFSTEQSAAFVNGVLDAILKEHRALTTAAPPGGPAAPAENGT